MAVLDYYVDTGAAAGGNGSSWALAYQSLAAALSGLAQNMVTTGNSIVIHCRASTGAADTTAPSFSGWTSDATHYLTIQVDAADRHAGIWDATKYRLQGGFFPMFNAPPAYTRFIGLQTYNTADDINTRHFLAGGTGTDKSAACQINHHIARWADKNYTYGQQMFLDAGTDQTTAPWIVQNVLYYGGIGTHGRTGSIAILTVNSLVTVENCTLIAGATNDTASKAISDGYSRVRAANILAKGWTSFGNPGASGTDYNAGDVASVPGTHSRSSQTFTFVDAANAKYQLASTDAGAKGYGEDLSADSVPLTDDITGTTRTAPWDIGAFIAQPSSVTATATGSANASAGAALNTGATATGTATASAAAAITSSATASGSANASAGAAIASSTTAAGVATASATPTVVAAAAATGAANASATEVLPDMAAATGIASASAIAVTMASASATGTASASAQPGGAGTNAMATGTASASATAVMLASASATGVASATSAATESVRATATGSSAATASTTDVGAATATGTATTTASGAAQSTATATGAATASAVPVAAASLTASGTASASATPVLISVASATGIATASAAPPAPPAKVMRSLSYLTPVLVVRRYTASKYVVVRSLRPAVLSTSLLLPQDN